MPHSSRSSDSISVSVAPTTSPSSDTCRPTKRDVYHKYGCFSLLAFFSHRVLRSGPKLFLYLGAILASLFVMTKTLPSGIQDTIATSTSKYWPLRPDADPILPLDNQRDAHIGGGLRIVVFGENDVATSNLRPIPGVDLGANNGTTWTQVMCSELRCTTYLSYVPMLKWPPVSVMSNTLFTETTEKVLAESKGKAPAEDYSFLAAAYPLRNKVADLASQIKTFLNQPKPERPPKETIFVLSFGTWDVWTLSSYPYNDADSLLSSMVVDMFEQIEELYTESQDPESIAFSDYTVAPAARTNSANATAEFEEEPGFDPEDASHVHQHRDGGISARSAKSILPWNQKLSQPFRIVVPSLLDPSVLPIWHMDRPASPKLHTKQEQIRSAVRLTSRWNDLVAYHMEEWMKKNMADPYAGNKESEVKLPPVNISSKKRRGQLKDPDRHNDDVADNTNNTNNTTSIPEPPMWREATLFRITDYILDIIIDSQLKVEERTDKKGFGTLDAKETFVETRRPCIDDNAKSHPAPAKEGVSRKKSPAICNMPDEHFFFTPYSLGRRGIENVGRFAAGLLKASESEKADYDKNVNVPDNIRKPATWKAYLSP